MPPSAPRFHLHHGDALDAYSWWPSPTVIVSDGAYGVRGFPGDPTTPSELPQWYRSHIEAWSKAATPATTLWFWNTEIGWANVHPLLVEYGWNYEFVITWNKGLAHVAGNVNGQTLRRWPIVTEICVMYSRGLTIDTLDGPLPVKDWMRYEWLRTGMPMYRANEACGVKNAATRKYLTSDWLWYWPPAEMMERLVEYANAKGLPSGRPYYSLDGKTPVTSEVWAGLRYKWNNGWHGITNVWDIGPLHSEERHRGTGLRSAPRKYNPGARSAAHLNQKPLEAMLRIVRAVSDSGDVLWEPFGGLASAGVAAVLEGRIAYAAEPVDHFAAIANERLMTASRSWLSSQKPRRAERISHS